MQQKIRPVYLVDSALDRLEVLGEKLQGRAADMTSEGLANIGQKIAELAREASKELWYWDDPDGRLADLNLNSREMVYEIMPVAMPLGDCPFP